jgi:hypothetical protein
MLSEWLQLQWALLPILAIPLAILLGMRWTNGAILVSGVGALLVIAFTWYRLATSPLDFSGGGVSLAESIVRQIGEVLLLAAWTLALAHAARSRRWVWLALIVVAGYLSYSTAVLAQLAQNPCAFGLQDGGPLLACRPPGQVEYLLIAVGQALGPVAAILYATLAARGYRRPRQLPEGLVVSSLRHGRVSQDEQDARLADEV